jgi:glycosyltransferase involved in cell wall biosynthesis
VEGFTTDADGTDRLAVPIAVPVERDGVAVFYFRREVPRRLYRSRRLGVAVRERVAEFDVVHLHSTFLWPTWVAARAAERARVPYVVSPRGMLVEELIALRGRFRKRLWIRFVERRTLSRAASIHVTSDRELDDLRALGLEVARTEVIPNGVDLDSPGDEPDRGPADLDRLAAEPFVLFLGRLTPKKQLPRLLEAMALVPDLRLVVAGGDDEGQGESLVRRATALGIKGRVEFVGDVRGTLKRVLLERCITLVLASRSENFGNAVVEAMAARRPVVVTEEVGASTIVRESGGGVVVEGTPAALAAALRSLHDDPRHASDLGEKGAAFVRRELRWDRIRARFDMLYRSATETRSGGATA